MTFALAGDVSDIEVSGTSNANGQETVVGNTVTWSDMTLKRN